MSELVLVDTENVGYNIIKTLDMEKVKKLILVDGSREENIRLSADILQTLLEYSNKGKIERIYTDKKEKNAADYLLILKIGMIISENSSNKSNIVIKILSGDKIFETIARILKEMNYNTEIGNIHNEKRQNKKEKNTISVKSNRPLLNLTGSSFAIFVGSKTTFIVALLYLCAKPPVMW